MIRNSSPLRKIALFLILPAWLVFTSACNLTTFGQTRTISDFVVVSTDNLDADSADMNHLRFKSSDPFLKEIEAGTVIASDVTPEAPNGFLRKVLEIRDEGEFTTLITEQAVLTEVVEDGGAEVNGSITPAGDSADIQGAGYSLHSRKFSTIQRLGYTVYGDERPASEIAECANRSFYLDVNGLEIEETATISGCVGFDLDFVMDLDISGFKMNSAEFSVTAGVGHKLDAVVTGAEVPLSLSFSVASFDLQPITFFIGPVPVVIVPKVNILLGVDGTVTIDLEVHSKNESTATAGLVYENGSWNTIKESSNSFEFDVPDFAGDVDAMVYVGPEATFLLYGVAGPGFNVFLYTDVRVEFDAIAEEVDAWEVWLGFQAGAKFSVELFDRNLFTISEPAIIGYQGLVASSEFDGLADPGIGKVTGVIGDAINGTYTPDNIVEHNLSGDLVTVGKVIAGLIPDSNLPDEEPVWTEVRIDGRCLDAGPGINLTLITPKSCNGSDSQKFWLDSEGNLRLKKNSEKCMDGLGVTPHINPVVWSCHGGNNQKWIYENNTLRNKHNESLYLTHTEYLWGLFHFAALKGKSGGGDQSVSLSQ